MQYPVGVVNHSGQSKCLRWNLGERAANKRLTLQVKVLSWQFVRFGQVDILDILNGNGQYESSEVNGQTAH